MTSIEIHTKYLPSRDSNLPALALQVTRLVNSYMLWVGTTDLPEEQVENAPSQGFQAKDWACAMPPLSPNVPVNGTALFRSAESDAAFAMAQRLARRFKKQIFLSVDVPPTLHSIGLGPMILLEVERGIIATLKELDSEDMR